MIEPPDRAMARAVELSRRGFPAPNPHVGCVLMKDGAVVGEGWHERAGNLHAEAMALAAAGSRAAGSDVFVTLEPCAHHGRTPPCADALIRAGAKKVFVAVEDPNPAAAGGAAKLRAAGIEVEIGLLRAEAEAANRVFLFAMREKRPYVNLKAAVTLDGFLARLDGTSQWITGEEARQEGHRRRAEMGCVLIGQGTWRTDRPRLTVRLEEDAPQPRRIVLDPKGEIPDDHGLDQRIGPEDLPVREGRFVLQDVLKLLAKQGEIGVLVEGGSSIISSFLQSGLVERLDLFVAPKFFGQGLLWRVGEEASFGLELMSASQVGEDGWMVYEKSGTSLLGPASE